MVKTVLVPWRSHSALCLELAPKIHIFTTAKRREVSYGPHCTVGAVTRVPSQIHCICTELGVTGTWAPLPHEAYNQFRAVHRHLSSRGPQPVEVPPHTDVIIKTPAPHIILNMSRRTSGKASQLAAPAFISIIIGVGAGIKN